MKTLAEGFNQTEYPLTHHGKRNVQVLKDALADVDGALDGDSYGNGAIIEDFQTELAKLLGKENAVFFPSGTMAQQIALRIHCDELGVKRVAYHPLCHLEIHEQDGMKELHHLEAVLPVEPDKLITLADVKAIEGKIACLLLELPQREIGGQLPPFAELEAISAYCREQGIRLHLDGARLFEVLPYYGKTAAEVAALFDSVYVSFYKGIGGIAGALLAGTEALTRQAKVWKRRHGGDLISLYPYILSAKFYLDRRLPLMAQFYADALELAALYNACPGVVTLPEVPVCNMFHVHIGLAKEQAESLLLAVYESTGVGLTGNLKERGPQECGFEVTLADRYAAVPKDRLQAAFAMLGQLMQEALDGQGV